jgi:hypothetical protein
VIGVVTVEPVLLLGKGIGETLVDVVEASIRSAATFALFLAMMPTIRVQLNAFWTVTNRGLFARSMDEGNKVGDEG